MTSKTTIPNFDLHWDLPQTPLKTAYIVCTAPRTGSNLLCFALAKQGIGTPLEYLNLQGNDSVQNFYSRITKSSLQADIRNKIPRAEISSKYIPAIINCRTSTYGFFGMKVFAHHFTNLFGDVDLSVLTPFIGCEPKLIHLVREDLIELTVSFIMARNSQRWHSEMASEKPKKTVYTFKEFFETMIELSTIQNKWHSTLGLKSKNDILRITYKQLSDNYTETMKIVNKYLGVTDTQIPSPSIKRQVSNTKLKLIEQFTMDCKRNVTQVRMAFKRSRHR